MAALTVNQKFSHKEALNMVLNRKGLLDTPLALYIHVYTTDKVLLCKANLICK